MLRAPPVRPDEPTGYPNGDARQEPDPFPGRSSGQGKEAVGMRDEMVGVADRPGRVVGRLCGVVGRLYGVVGIIRVAHVFRVARFKSCATGCRATRAEGLRAGRKKATTF